MNIQKFTQKSIEAINQCEKLAYEYGNQRWASTRAPSPTGYSALWKG